MTTSTHAVWVAWLLTSVYYFYQYALRAAPAVMMPRLSHALNLNPVGIASLAVVFYYGYSPFSLAVYGYDRPWRHSEECTLECTVAEFGCPGGFRRDLFSISAWRFRKQ
ncbi:MAG TPA: hypothetical protein VIX91_17995 [Candidatus Acidoferrum sp.]